jgi:hypothetical protein
MFVVAVLSGNNRWSVRSLDNLVADSPQIALVGRRALDPIRTASLNGLDARVIEAIRLGITTFSIFFLWEDYLCRCHQLRGFRGEDSGCVVVLSVAVITGTSSKSAIATLSSSVSARIQR